jgi:uncharacterized protein YdhG (YjbR/CyaY superfamily)
MPSPKRASLDDYFAQLTDTQAPHVARLRELSLAAAPGIEEKLAWNNPAYHLDDVRLWMIQSYEEHCSLRFPPHQFSAHRSEVEQAGYEAGEGFLKVRYDQDFPDDLAARLIGYRLEEYAETGSTWSGT